MLFLRKMSPRLKVSSYVIERVADVDAESTEGATGCVYGLMHEGTVHVLGFSLEPVNGEHGHTALHLPTELDLCGVLNFVNSPNTESNILQNVDMTDNPVVLNVSEDGTITAHFVVHDRLEPTPYEVLTEDELLRNFIHLKVDAILPIICEATTQALQKALLDRRKKIAAGAVVFHLEGTSVYVVGEAGAEGAGDAGVGPEPTLSQLLNTQLTKKKKYTLNNVEVVPVNALIKVTKDLGVEKIVRSAVKMVTTQGKLRWARLQVRVSGLALVARDVRAFTLYSVLVETACRTMRLLDRAIAEQGPESELQQLDTRHFLPPELGHFVTLAIPAGRPDAAYESRRRALHSRFRLPHDRPCFRRGNAFPPATSLLINPHEALPPPSAAHALVRGRYAYHHYMQDRFDDGGWGCAYRSLQTLASWLRLQGYTSAATPTHREIQQCLVDIGDKPASFVGSRQWIGSTEVSFVLETLLGVTSRIIFASSGAELAEYTPQLAHHFRTHGSPVMIGGGVLAHTILGVQWSDAGTRYLVLDPHYTGADDLAAVVGKGWCAWKGAEFWDKTAHYNLCLPQTKPCI